MSTHPTPDRPRTASPRWTTENTALATWFERDRAHVWLVAHGSDTEILDVWDDEVSRLVEDGFLDPRDWHRSALDYANHLGL